MGDRVRRAHRLRTAITAAVVVLAVAGVLAAVARSGQSDGERPLRLATGRPPPDLVVPPSTSTSTTPAPVPAEPTTTVATVAPDRTVRGAPAAPATTTAPSGGRRTTTTLAGRATTTRPPGPTHPSTTTTAVGEAPAFVSAVGDLDASRVTVTFDRPVEPGTIARAPMYLVVYGSDPGCGTPDGNGQRFVGGGGSPTVTVEATSLVRGITYVTVGSGFVESTEGRVANRAQGCTAIRVD